MTPIAPRAGGVALFWVVAIACFLAVTAGIAARLADRTAGAWNTALRSTLIARIVAPDAPSALDDAAIALNATPDVDNVRIVTPERATTLLRSLGVTDLQIKDLPAPRLITFRAASDPTNEWAKSVEAQLHAAGFDVEVYGPGPNLREAADNARKIAIACFAVSAMIASAALLTAGLAGRARVAVDCSLIPPLTDMGATRGQVSGAFAGRAAVDGFLAGLLGALAALAPAYWLMTNADRLGAPFTEWIRGVEWTDAAPFASAPLLAALLAAAGARTASNRFYMQAARRT